MRLTELEPQFLRVVSEHVFSHVKSIDRAQGIRFLCPKCFQKNKGPVGTHSIICWFKGVPANIYPAPGRWEVSGTGLEDLTLSPSIDTRGCWHGYIKDGEAA